MAGKLASARGTGGGADVSVADSPLATFESLTQAAVIAVMGIAIVISNLLIIAAFLNFKGNNFTAINYIKLPFVLSRLPSLRKYLAFLYGVG